MTSEGIYNPSPPESLDMASENTRAFVYSDPLKASVGFFIRIRTRASPSYGAVLRKPFIQTSKNFSLCTRVSLQLSSSAKATAAGMLSWFVTFTARMTNPAS